MTTESHDDSSADKPVAIGSTDGLGLVERLRDWASNLYVLQIGEQEAVQRDCALAAQEIRRLRAQLKHCGGDNCMGRKMGQMTTWVTEQAADARVAAEREQCAKLCEAQLDEPASSEWNNAVKCCAAALRARAWPNVRANRETPRDQA